MNAQADVRLQADRGDSAGHTLPTGTVTFLLTDVQDSTPAWEAHPVEMASAMARHEEIVAASLQQYRGVRPRDQGEGDSILAVFARAGDAVACALELQRAIAAERWPLPDDLRVRMALHTGEADVVTRGNYQGVAIIRAARVRSLASGGQILLTAGTASVVRDRLPDSCRLVDLGLHRLKGLHNPEHVLALAHPDLPAVEPISTPDRPTMRNLPPVLTSFVGRSNEQQHLTDALRAHRLVTVVGEGGAGKTRLAVEAAADLADWFPDGVYFVDLSSLGDDALVDEAVAGVIGASSSAGSSLADAIATHVADRKMVVILDNAEHLVASAADVAHRMLAAGLGVAVLATSQCPLAVAGEHVLRLDALPEHDAAHLFVQRAEAAAPGQGFHADDPLVRNLCRRLDGLPLAVELAAARARAVSLTEMSELLEDRFRLLRGGGGPERHRTLRGVLDWSYSLLSRAEATVLRRLAAFSGSFSLEAAEDVVGFGDIDPLDVLDLLTALIDRSLVRRQSADGMSRYRLLDSVRTYAAEQLDAAHELDTVHDRLLSWLDAATARAQLRGADLPLWVNRLAHEDEVIRGALAWATGQRHRVEDAARIVERLSRYWVARGLLDEADAWVAAVLECDATPAAEANVMLARGRIEMNRADVERASAALERGIALARENGLGLTLAHLLTMMGILSWNFERRFDPIGHEEALAIYREIGDERGIADTIYASGLMTWQGGGDREAGVALIEESVRRYEALGDPAAAADSRTCIGAAALNRGDLGRAQEVFAHTVEEFRRLGHVSMLVQTLVSTGFIAMFAGDAPVARRCFEEVLELADAADQPAMKTSASVGLARMNIDAGDVDGGTAALAAALDDKPLGTMLPFLPVVALAGAAAAGSRGDHYTAAVLGAAAAHMCARSVVFPPGLAPPDQAVADQARAALGDETFEAACAEGASLEWDDLDRLVRQVTTGFRP